MMDDDIIGPCRECRFYRGPLDAPESEDLGDEKNIAWACMHPLNYTESFCVPMEDCPEFKPNTFGTVDDPRAATHYALIDGSPFAKLAPKSIEIKEAKNLFRLYNLQQLTLPVHW